MKKFTFIFAFVALAFGFSFSQATFVVTTPSNNATSANRLPNGTSGHAYFRGATLVLTTELSAIPVSTTLSSIGFTTATGATSAVTGSITIYAQNSGDVTFSKGTTWSGVTPGMTVIYSGTMTVPATAASFDLPLTTPFIYTGGSMYLAYDWYSPGTYATTGAVWASNNTGLTGGCISGISATTAPTVCVTSSFRPCVRFGFPNSLTNDVSVETINSMGSVAKVFGFPTGINAIVRNNSNGPLSNINVSANIIGANTYSDLKTVASLAAGATATVTFNNWSPLSPGANTINVTVPADQNNTNNARSFNSKVTCNTSGVGENPINYTQSIGFNTTSGILSTILTSPVAATVTGVNVAISTNTAAIGNGVYGVMLDNLGAILAVSVNTLTIASGDLNTLRSFTFSPPVAVTASQVFYLGMAQPTNTTVGYYPFGSYINPYLATSYFTNAITGGTLAIIGGNLGQFGIEANFAGSCVGLGVNNAVVSSDNNLSVYPNPASTSLNVKLGSVSDKATVEVYNTIGQIVIASQEVTNNSTEINVSTLAKGVYILKVSNGKEVSNTKFVIER